MQEFRSSDGRPDSGTERIIFLHICCKKAMFCKLRNLLSLLVTVNPSQRPTVEKVKSHPWLMKDKDFPDDREEMILSQPDPDTAQAMEHLGFHANDIKNSLIRRKFNMSMVLYVLLHRQAGRKHGPTAQGQPINLGVTPFPSLEDHATFPLSPRRRGSEPAGQVAVVFLQSWDVWLELAGRSKRPKKCHWTCYSSVWPSEDDPHGEHALPTCHEWSCMRVLSGH